MYNENNNNVYDNNNNISNKNQLDLSLSNIKPDDWWLEWLKRRKKLTLGRLQSHWMSYWHLRKNTTTLNQRSREMLTVFNVLYWRV